jgi:hypothetical protein
MAARLDAMYASGGRPSIAPERLLTATLLIALYSVRSDRLFLRGAGLAGAVGATRSKATSFP